MQFYNIYLSAVGIAWLVYLQFDIYYYTRMMEKFAAKQGGPETYGELKKKVPPMNISSLF